MSCPNQIGVKNVLIAFTDCDNGTAGGIGNVAAIAHDMAQDSLPEYDFTGYKLEGVSGGRVKRTYENAKIKLKIIRNLGIPLAYYQGRASMDVQIEHINGSTVTGLSGFVTDKQESDGNEVELTLEFKPSNMTEVLPPGSSLQQ